MARGAVWVGGLGELGWWVGGMWLTYTALAAALYFSHIPLHRPRTQVHERSIESDLLLLLLRGLLESGVCAPLPVAAASGTVHAAAAAAAAVWYACIAALQCRTLHGHLPRHPQPRPPKLQGATLGSRWCS